MDRNAWKIKDKAWVSERKTQWALIKKNLEHTEHFDKTEIKVFGEYFSKGIEPCDKDSHAYKKGAYVLMPLLFYLWLHPDHSFENWNSLKDHVLQSDEAEIKIEKSYTYLISNFSHQPKYCVENGLMDGMYGGCEERLIKFLCGLPGNYDLIKVSNPKFEKGNGVTDGGGFFRSLVKFSKAWLAAKEENPNPHFVYRYLLEYWHQLLLDKPEILDDWKLDEGANNRFEQLAQENKLPDLEEGERISLEAKVKRHSNYKFMVKHLGYIKKFYEKHQEDTDVRSKYVKKFVSIMEDDKLPEKLKTMWGSA